MTDSKDARDTEAARVYNANWEERLQQHYQPRQVRALQDRLYGIRVVDEPRPAHAGSFQVICPEHGVVAKDEDYDDGWCSIRKARAALAEHQERHPIAKAPISGPDAT